MKKRGNIFQQAAFSKMPRSTFDLTHEVKMSAKMGKLTPFYVQEVVPGDTFSVTSEMLVRMMPTIAPIMHRVNVITHYFFVPYRIVWNEFEDFVTGGDDGKASPEFPKINLEGTHGEYVGISNEMYQKGSLYDYLGLPVPELVGGSWQTITVPLHISALPFRAYQMIWNEFYRDQNLQDKVDFSLASGVLTYEEAEKIMAIKNRNWEKDYFTSALPFAQKGDDVYLPLTGNADVGFKDGASQLFTLKNRDEAVSTVPGKAIKVSAGVAPGHSTPTYVDDDDSNTIPLGYDLDGKLEADLSDATMATINDVRTGFAVQRFLEKLARGGSRFTEYIKSFYNVNSSDARLQRPEYLGGGMAPVVISEVLQTSSSDDVTPQGNMSGHAISVGQSNSFRKFFEEPGVIIGIMSVMPRTAYQQGMPKMFRRFDKFDFYIPVFAHLGEQEVKREEVVLDFAAGDDDPGSVNAETFGYQSRYADYRSALSRVAGEMRDTLAFWHMGRILDNYGTKIELNSDFVTCQPRKDIFPVTLKTEDELYIQIVNKVLAKRPMPYNAEPGLVDHF